MRWASIRVTADSDCVYSLHSPVSLPEAQLKQTSCRSHFANLNILEFIKFWQSALWKAAEAWFLWAIGYFSAHWVKLNHIIKKQHHPEKSMDCWFLPVEWWSSVSALRSSVEELHFGPLRVSSVEHPENEERKTPLNWETVLPILSVNWSFAGWWVIRN